MAYNALQSAKYDSNTAATSHTLNSGSTLWWPTALATPGGTTTPSTIIVSVSYPGTSSDQVSSIIDDQGNTYYKAVTANDNTNEVHNELWYAHNAAGGVKPSLTVNLASSLKCTFVASEFPYIWWFFDPIDQSTSQIDTATSVQRSTPSAGTTNPNSEADDLVIGSLGWNNSVTTTIANGLSSITDTYDHNSSSNLGAAIGHRYLGSAASPLDLGTTVSKTVNRIFFNIGGSSRNTPHAVCVASFKRVGVFTTTTQDGIIQNIEGTPTVDTTDTTDTYAAMTSPSAPNGGTGSSELTCYYAFIDTTKFGSLPAGVTLTVPIYVWRSQNYSGDDTSAFYGMRMYFDPTGGNGTTLDGSDEGNPNNQSLSEYMGLVVVATQDNNLAISDDSFVNTAGLTNLRHAILSNTPNASVQFFGLRTTSAHFFRFTVTYPEMASPPARMRTGFGQ